MSWASRLREFNIWFQLHWILGITAGAVLVVVGVTGGLMSFQQDILEWLNADRVAQLDNGGPRLSPPALVARYNEAHPEHTVTSLFWRQDRPYPMLIGYRTSDTSGGAAERAIVDPATAEPLGLLRGQWTFGLIRHIHERLAAGEIGRFIVGVSTLTLVILCLSGLWIRWRRRPRQRWRWVWPRALGGKLAGEWHAVLGLWALLAYLIASLTGLWWSFEWYQDGAKAVFASETGEAHLELSPPAETLDLARIWQSIAPKMSDARSVFIRLPDEPTAMAEVHYVPGDSFHRYADNELFVHPSTGKIVGRERYDDKTAGDQLLASVYALHMGAFFGTPGVVIMMIASLAMPVFFITGWILYIRRRRMKRQIAPAPRIASDAPADTDALLVAYASQSGLAQRIATQTAATLQSAGQPVHMTGLGELKTAALRAHKQALFIVSTHGEGDAPVAARGFDRRFCGSGEPQLEGLDYALLSLGDTDYEDTYCAFGRRLDRALRERGARTLLAPIEVDKADVRALGEWHNALAGLFGAAASSAEPAFDSWRLTGRQVLNPGSLGESTAWLRLEPTTDTNPAWQAGDIAEVRPRQPETAVHAWLRHHTLDHQATVVRGEAARPLAYALADRRLPADAACAHYDLQAWFDKRAPLAARDYSIANIGGHAVELLVRLTRDGHDTGLASGWLIERARIGEAIDLRLRANPGFRADAACHAAPAILIGNGTGIAGLRSHLQARIAAGQHTNWLLFGERQRAVDFYFGDQIRAWHARGAIAHLDLAFSRDADDGRYVQTALAERAERLRHWIDDGACVFVCGSHDGMAPGVIRVLVEILGAANVERLNETQRIRMDVY